MKRKKKLTNPMIVTGHESHFDAMQVVMAALTWAEAGPAEAVQATEAILSLNKDKAVAKLVAGGMEPKDITPQMIDTLIANDPDLSRFTSLTAMKNLKDVSSSSRAYSGMAAICASVISARWKQKSLRMSERLHPLDSGFQVNL